MAKKLLLVGWDAADWKIINPLLDSGQMPALERLVNRGVMGNIATLDPPLSPMLWTSIATGKTADKHGILNFVEPHPDRAEVRPVSSTSRKVKAFWNILNQQGLKCNIAGWWPSNPAEPINGVMISNLFMKATSKPGEEWPLYAGSVHPASLNDVIADMRIHPSELTLNHLTPFVANTAELAKDPNRKDKLLERLTVTLAECSTVHNAATWMMENTEWDVMAVYYDAIDVTCHTFMKFHPPQMPGVPDEYFNTYKNVVSSMYRYHDMMLDRLLDLAGEDTTVMLLSDHGFHSDHLRPKALPNEPDAPALEHRPFGVFCISGPGIKKDDRVYGATLLDIAPTILTLFGQPVGADMNGKVLTSVFEDEVKPEFIESWENVEGDSGMHPAEVQEDPLAAQEALQQLVELGYIEAPGPDMEKNLKQVIAVSNFNLARVLLNNREYEKALPVLKKLHEDFPGVPRYGFRYASCLHRLKRMEECREVIDTLRNVNKRDMPRLDLLEAQLLLSENQPRKALEKLANAEKTGSHMPVVFMQLGSTYNSIQRWDDAVRAYSRALEIDPENAGSLLGRGIANLRLDKLEDAINDLLDSIGLLYHQPQAHYFLGEALFKYGEYERAAEALQVCIKMEPGFRRAYGWLVKIFGEKLNDPQKAQQFKEFMDKNIQGTVTIVSGLPRSGTSMMMQMLRAGGLEILTDNIRKEDNNNPKGYYEYEKVKKLSTDNTWLEEANGKVVKVVTQLLHFLPPAYNYRIINMNRSMHEVLRSQQVMLGKPANEINVTIAQVYQKQVEKSQAWIKGQPNVQVLNVEYTDAVSSPREVAEAVSNFLGMELDLDAMEKAVDASLYRNKVEVAK